MRGPAKAVRVVASGGADGAIFPFRNILEENEFRTPTRTREEILGLRLRSLVESLEFPAPRTARKRETEHRSGPPGSQKRLPDAVL